MFNSIIPIASILTNIIANNVADIAKKAGVPTSVANNVMNSVNEIIQKDEKIKEQIISEIEKARTHDVKTQIRGILIIDVLRGLVRPVISFVAISWYIYARLNEISLTTEDYAIIGGIIAFWFGMRPFEKNQNKF